MRLPCIYFLAVMLLGAGLCAAESDINASIKLVLLKKLNFTENYSVSYFDLNGDNYGFVAYTRTITVGTGANATKVIKTGEIFALNLSTDVSLIANGTELDSLLRARNRWLMTDLVNEIRGDIVTFNQSRELEAKCKSSLGLDRALCWDADTCLYRSCIYSQAICLPFAQGNGKPFLNAMASFSKATVEIDLGLSEFMRDLNSFAEKKTDSAPKESVITNIEAQVASIRGNSLFVPYSSTTDGFEFCTPIPYRTDALSSAKTKLGQLIAKLSSDSTINKTRDTILNETLSRIKAIELANNLDAAYLTRIRANASAEYDSVRRAVENSSGIIAGKTIDERVAYLNKTLERILTIGNSSVALTEYFALVNESANTRDIVAEYVKEVDELVKLSNECSAVLADADLKVKSPAGKARLEEVKARRESLESIMSLPIKEDNIVSAKAGLNSIKNQAGAIIIEEAAPESTGPDYIMIGGVLLALALIGALYWLFSSGKLPIGRKKPQAGVKPAQPMEATEQPAAVQAGATIAEATKAPQVRKATAPVVHYRVKLALQGGAYRTKIKSAIKDKNGNPVPDGTTVAFSADTGAITPSAVTKGGTAFASMVFKQKPAGVTISVTAVGITRSIRIDFV